MKKRFFTILLLFTSCTLSSHEENVQQKPERMEQREKTTELNYFENPRYINKPQKFIAEDGNLIYNDATGVDEYTPPKNFHMIQKLYYKDGTLKTKTVFLLFSCIKSEECDENGFLIKKEEYQLRKRVDGMDYASFFEKEGWYDRSTGQTAFREEPYPLNTGEFTEMVMRCISYTSNHSTRYIRITNIKKGSTTVFR